MSDIAAIAALVASIKNAMDIAKALKGVDATIAHAELRLKMADLLVSLAEAREATTEFRDVLAEKDAEITRLTEVLAVKETVVRRFSGYYKKGTNGKAVGDPYCLRCWEAEHKLFHIVRDGKANGHRCPVCTTLYDYYETQHGLQGTEEEG